MYLIDQHTKKIMEECKERARDAGLKFESETLEYIVTNRDLLELSPKAMIPTLYDYWVYDVEVLKEYGKYKLYPTNPYETVINSRPAISFYNDNNPDWLNIMIFYHVIAHIDFFQNNILFQHTWNDDFVGQALADKRLIEKMRSEYGRWVDYVIEFARSIDNIVGYYHIIADNIFPNNIQPNDRISYYFDEFLQNEIKLSQHEIYKQILHFNELTEIHGESAEPIFFAEVRVKYPEFEAKYDKYKNRKQIKYDDLLEFIRDNSPFLKKEANQWMSSILTIIRNTALYFAPQIRTKIINEGWASYWHDRLFLSDDRIKGNEVSYAKINAGVTSINRIGLNPYAIGLRLIEYVEDLAEKGKLDYKFQINENYEFRENYNKKTGKGKEAIFNLRTNFSDFTLINVYCTQEFIDKNDLFVVGRKFIPERQVYQYYVKSRKAEDYKKMLLDSLYHPCYITVDLEKTSEDCLYLIHHFEGKQLIKEFIPDVLIGLEFLWGGKVQLETTEIIKTEDEENETYTTELQKVLYTSQNRKVSKTKI